MFAAGVFLESYSSNNGRIEFWAAAGAVFGVVLFFRGFHMLQLKRLILNTPESKIRSASMGLVEIEGMAKGPRTISAGITGDPCFYYRAMAWQLRESGKNREWKKVADESLYVPFFLEDSTGRMLINPAGAELDVHCNFKDQIGDTFFSRSDMMPPSCSAFLGRNGLALTDSTRLEEYCIKPEYPLFVLGTLGAKDGAPDWSPVAQIGTGVSLKSRLNPFGSAGNFAFQVFGASVGIAATPSQIDASKVPVSRSASRSSSFLLAGSEPVPAPSSSWSDVSADETNMGALAAVRLGSATCVASPESRVENASQRRDRSEPVEGVATSDEASCVARTDGFEQNPTVAIGKGTTGTPFTISSNSQREVVKELAWKSVLCIWGGPTVTLVCLYILSICLGWITF